MHFCRQQNKVCSTELSECSTFVHNSEGAAGTDINYFDPFVFNFVYYEIGLQVD